MDNLAEFTYWILWLLLCTSAFSLISNIYLRMVADSLDKIRQSQFMIAASALAMLGFAIMIAVYHNALEYLTT